MPIHITQLDNTMKNKLLALSLIGLTTSVAYFVSRCSDTSDNKKLTITTNFQQETNNQICRAKGRLYQAAAEYINRIEHFSNYVTHKNREFEARTRACMEFTAKTSLPCSLPHPSSLDPIPYTVAIENATYQLKVSISQFQVDVHEVRYRACKEIGYLCLPREDKSPFEVLWKDLPATEFDPTILEAIGMLPKTESIMKRIASKLSAINIDQFL